MMLTNRHPSRDLVEALRPIAVELSRGGTILLYCRSGKNRSVALAGLVLGSFLGRHDEDMVEWIKSLRGLSRPKHLQHYEHSGPNF